MDENSIINLIANDNYIIINRSLIKELGLKETILLGELASEFNYYKANNLLDKNGYFYSTIENIENNTTLSSYEQKKCLDNLASKNIINIILKGMPAKRHIKINSEMLLILFANNLETSFLKNKKQVSEKLRTNNNNINNNNIKESNNINIITKEKFKKPTLEEVKAYCVERNNGVDAELFINHYESNGWKVGKTPMKDWKAAVRTWERSTINKQQERKETIYEAM